MNITQINKMTVEDIQELSTEELLQAKDVLSKSKAKQSRLRRDIIDAQLKQRDDVPEQVEQLTLTEETTEDSTVTETTDEEEIDESDEEEETEVKKERKVPRKRKKKTESEDKELLAQIEALQKQIDSLQESKAQETFPPELTLSNGVELQRLGKLKTEEIQRYLVEKPFRLLLAVDEKIDGELTIFRVLFLNDKAFVILDLTRTLYSTINAIPSNLNGKVLSLDGKNCPYEFYIEEGYLLDEEEETK